MGNCNFRVNKLVWRDALDRTLLVLAMEKEQRKMKRNRNPWQIYLFDKSDNEKKNELE